MATKSSRPRGFVRKRGNSYQVLVYAGVDPLTGKDSYLTESTRDERQIERVRTKLLGRVDQQRNAATKATLGYTLDAWFEVHDADPVTLAKYREYAERFLKPAIGDVAIAKLSARILEQFYGQLRRCRRRCGGKSFIEHWTDERHECGLVRHRRRREHDCAAARCRVLECKPHECEPLAASTIRQLHFIISGALGTAVRWDWIPSNPATVAKKPRLPRPKPTPPTPSQVARIVAAAWERDEAWGTLVWLVMVTGIRRGELVALRWRDIHLEAGVLEVRRNYVDGIEKDPKTHQIRRISLDEGTCQMLRSHHDRYAERIAELGIDPSEDAYVFSYEPDHSRPCNPDAVSHRYTATCSSVGVDSHLHALRHYSATELITQGVDLRTVAGRLGHAGGGTTTLRVYTAWVPESDKRAAAILAGRMAPPNAGRK
ncbi:site-specific integrase [Actinopolymorpha sp. B9G3]|uniref:tyrosine-type recombinase/integrase n=1 Tax=Actinopolymorpha sp. B9G3 TaxID=3158970 RepID=UPI0032D955E5